MRLLRPVGYSGRGDSKPAMTVSSTMAVSSDIRVDQRSHYAKRGNICAPTPLRALSLSVARAMVLSVFLLFSWGCQTLWSGIRSVSGNGFSDGCTSHKGKQALLSSEGSLRLFWASVQASLWFHFLKRVTCVSSA